MDLAAEIKSYYLSNYQRLPKHKQFHLASRLAAWEGSPAAFEILRELRPYMVPGDKRAALSVEMNRPVRRVYGYNLRKKYFEKYPDLFGLHESLFKIRHWKEIYGIDARDELVEVAGRDTMTQLYEKLTDDREALMILSRFAVDFIYLYETYFSEPRFDPKILLDYGDPHNDDETRLNLFIYLYTHAIIAETNFYIRHIPEDKLPIYRQMLVKMEPLLLRHKIIKLDTQIEHLVASRLCGDKSKLEARIVDIASRSLSPDGKFIIDEVNQRNFPSLNSFSGSEHRNVLFIMSMSPYKPHDVLIA
jgi:hypothetical protein